MKKAVQFGAGNIGRGFIGALLSQSGYHVVFADVVDKIIDKINEDKPQKVLGIKFNQLYPSLLEITTS